MTRRFALVKHNPNDEKKYLFEVPLDMYPCAGSFVMVETRHGNQYGEICNVITTFNDNDADFILELSGGKECLKKIIHVGGVVD